MFFSSGDAMELKVNLASNSLVNTLDRINEKYLFSERYLKRPGTNGFTKRREAICSQALEWLG
ncbi:MAG: hypothetical protein C3F13_13525 [Anaerolineales bacterium]|nr:hypothetical protein [Anaerolineae bacterium]PWB51457.1 MAG: hypothetical protein C3F13_13525 [Anaerolineales bacterium]